MFYNQVYMKKDITKPLEYIETFINQIYRRQIFKWLINKALITLSALLSVYLFWLIFNKSFFMTRLEWRIFPLMVFLCFVPFLFGKPNLSGSIEFLEQEIKDLKGRLYLVMNPYPSTLDSENYKDRAIKECASILKREEIQNLTPISWNRRRCMFLVSGMLVLTLLGIVSGGVKLERISDVPIITYSDKKVEENCPALIIAKSNRMKRMYLFSNKGVRQMFYLGNNRFGIFTKFEESSEVQVGYRTWKSSKEKLKVIPSLFVKKLTLKYKFPYYLEASSFSDTLYNLEEEILIQALTGTQIDFSGESNLTLVKMEGKIKKKQIKGKKFSGGFTLNAEEEISISLSDSSFFSTCVLNFFIDPIKDEPPSIEFISPQNEYKLKKSMEVPVILRAEDDYGLSSVSLLHRDKKTELKTNTSIRFVEDSLTLRIRNLMTGETLKLRGRAIDLAGNKTLSSPILIYMPTIEEIFHESRAMRDSLEIFSTDIGEREKEIANKIENLLYKSTLNHETRHEIKKTLKEQKNLVEGMQKLAELAEEIRTPEVSREIDRIKELVDNPQIRDFFAELNKTLENQDISPEELRNLHVNQEELMKNLELFKKSLEHLKKLLEFNEFSFRAEEIYKKQKKITSSKADEYSSNLEKELSEELERLIREMEKSSQKEIKNIASEFKKTNTVEDMENLSQLIKKGTTNEKTVMKIEDNLRRLNLSLQKIRQHRAGGKITEALKEKAWELGFILRTHNNLTDMNPGLEKGLIEQGLWEALDRIERELQGLFLLTLGFSPDIFKDIVRAKEKLRALSFELIEKDVPKSSMERVNDPLIQAILKLFSSSPPSSESLASALRQIIEQQNSIMNGLGKNFPIPVPNHKAKRKLTSLSAKQRQLAETLGEMGKAFEPLSSEMKKMAEDLERGMLDKKLIERQRKVLDRLMEAERALREGELSRKRRSEPGIFVSPEKVYLPKNLGEKKKKLRELLEKRINEPYPEEYKKEVEEYFRRLIE